MSAQHVGMDAIQPWTKNPTYWQYRGEPALFLGGSVEDNLFQIPDLKAHLDLLRSVGGNYVRNTMSSRDPGNLWPFARDQRTGLYDLEHSNDAYWQRFARFLKLTAERDIIVQIELWDRFDLARDPWQENPFNPKNNRNYSAAESTLPEVITTHPGQNENPFFFSVPDDNNNTLLLAYQHAFIDKLLSYSLSYGHVLYCMDNETNGSPAWGAYWARYLHEKAAAHKLPIHTTEMWDAWDLADPMHEHTFAQPTLYTFADISQNNHQKGQQHWDNLQKARRRILESGCARPLNNVKIYGADTGRYGDDRDGGERFWRNIFGGAASARFHRPPSGLGLSETAQAHLKSARLLTARIDVFSAEPRNDLLGERSPNEAYCLAEPSGAYAVFFPGGGEVVLDVSAAVKQPLELRWLDIGRNRWLEPQAALGASASLRLRPPGEGFWAALIGT